MHSFSFMRGKKAVHAPIIAVLFFGAILWSNPSAAAGALAIGLPGEGAQRGFTYGRSVNYPDVNQAEAGALNECRTSPDAAKNANLRSLCKVIQDFSNQCAAVAMDPQAGTPGVGWAIANDKQTAEAQALAKCEATAGPGRQAACRIDHQSLCDGSAK